jgi:hypothetical protein
MNSSPGFEEALFARASLGGSSTYLILRLSSGD